MFENSSSSGAGGGMPPGDDLDTMISAFVAGLKLEEKLDPSHQMTGNLELDLHRLEALRIYIWRELEQLVRLLTPLVVERGGEMHEDHMKDCLKIAFDEYVVKAHRLLLRRTLEGKTVSLTDVAKEVFITDLKEFGDFRARLRDNYLPRMRDIGLWSFEKEHGVSKNGGDYHKGFKIQAGPILMAFHKHIYVVWAKQQTLFACQYLSRKDQ